MCSDITCRVNSDVCPFDCWNDKLPRITVNVLSVFDIRIPRSDVFLERASCGNKLGAFPIRN